MPTTPIIGQPSPSAGAANASHVIDVDERSFEKSVLDASFERPVVVDLWATWCGPCKQLSPVLEGLAAEAEGQWLLAKVDVDQSPRLAQYFQAQSIPMVLAIYQGQLLSQFAGAIPKREIERWLDEVFRRAGLELKKAATQEAPADPDQAIAFYRRRLGQRADDNASKLALGRLLFARGDVADAEKILQEIPFGAPEHGAARASLALKELISEIGRAGGEAAVREQLRATPEDVDARYHAAVADGTRGRYGPALEALVGQVGLSSSQNGINPEQKSRAKKAAAMLLEAAGRGDPEVEAQRKRLTRLLF